jgi:hypothetical protein
VLIVQQQELVMTVPMKVNGRRMVKKDVTILWQVVPTTHHIVRNHPKATPHFATSTYVDAKACFHHHLWMTGEGRVYSTE